MHRRKGSRRRKNWIIPVVLLALVVICVLLMRFVFVVRSVEIAGNAGGMSDEGVMRTARIGFGSSILKVNANEIEDYINATGTLKFEGMEIRYPDTVCIRVSARSREAMMLQMGKIRILDADACVVESLDEVPDMDLIYVSGIRTLQSEQGKQIRADDGQVEAYCAVIGALNHHGADIYVSELQLGSIQDIRIITRTGITVQLGSADKMQDKIAWMKSAVADLEQRGEGGGTLDVSSGTKADYRVTAP